MPVFNAQGLPVQFVLLVDRNFADLASRLSVGQTLRGRVTEVLADGKAVVSFRGIPVTADLKGVTLAKGETITVRVRDLGGSPQSAGTAVFQLIPNEPKVAARPETSPGSLSPSASLLESLGLPRDGFHEAIARVLLEYGVRPLREDIVAVKDMTARLPALVDRASETVSQPVTASRTPGGIAGSATGNPAASVAGDAGTVGLDLIETAVYMHLNRLPPGQQAARAAYEYLFGEIRIPEVLTMFESAAEAFQTAQSSEGLNPRANPGVSTTTVPEDSVKPVLAATTRALSAARTVRVSPGTDRLSEQLKDAVEGMGLAHEARLARAVENEESIPAGKRPHVRSGKGSSADGARERQVDSGRETLKAAMLDLSARIDSVLARPEGKGVIHARRALESLRDAADEVVSVVQSQQVGSMTHPDSTSIITVQIPIVLGAELRGGDIQMSWRRGKEGKKRDPHFPGQMSLEMETRALGPVSVRMRLLGNGLSLVFRVFDSEVRNFIGGELPDLVERLTGLKFRVGDCKCELSPIAGDGSPASRRPLRPTSSLDVTA